MKQGQRLADAEPSDRSIDFISLDIDAYRQKKTDLLRHSQQPDSPQELAALEHNGSRHKMPVEME